MGLLESTKKLLMPCWDTTAGSNGVARACGMISAMRQVVKTVATVMPCARQKAWSRAGGDDRPGDASALPFRRMLPHAQANHSISYVAQPDRRRAASNQAGRRGRLYPPLWDL